jgi:hypothetical protein
MDILRLARGTLLGASCLYGLWLWLNERQLVYLFVALVALVSSICDFLYAFWKRDRIDGSDEGGVAFDRESAARGLDEAGWRPARTSDERGP